MNRSFGLHAPDTVAIGVTGHRFLRDVDEIVPIIDQVLAGIQTRWPDLPLTVLSALAEGGDRLVVQRALALCQARLVIPLPMPVDEYVEDFQSAGSVEEFRMLLDRAAEIVHMPPAPDRPAAYVTSSDYILAHSDILIALWDGRPARGEGGTATVVASARRRAHPLVWIHAHNCWPGLSDTRCRESQGKVSYENM